MPNVRMVAKLNHKTNGIAPQLLLAQPENVSKLKVNVIAGIVKAVKMKENKETGEVFEQLVGDFRAINPDTGESTASAVLYLPTGIHEMVADPVKEGAKDLEFAINIYAVRAKNAAGYSWEAELLSEVKTTSPVDKLLESLVATKRLALPQLAAPADQAAETKAKK